MLWRHESSWEYTGLRTHIRSVSSIIVTVLASTIIAVVPIQSQPRMMGRICRLSLTSVSLDGVLHGQVIAQIHPSSNETMILLASITVTAAAASHESSASCHIPHTIGIFSRKRTPLFLLSDFNRNSETTRGVVARRYRDASSRRARPRQQPTQKVAQRIERSPQNSAP
jgi:hypothetical protein